MTATPARTASVCGSLRLFLAERVPTRVYGTYAVVWVLGLNGLLALLGGSGGTGWLRWDLAAEVLSVYLALVFARMVDDLKDLDYDRRVNPDRPVPRGAVRPVDLKAAMAAIVVVEVVVNVLRSPWLGLLIVAFLAYDCVLVLVEKWAPAIGASMFRNLVVTYPVQVILSVHIGVAAGLSGLPVDGGALAVAALFAAGLFLHYEFGRKTSRAIRPGTTLYSNVVGVRLSVFLTVLAAGLALGVAALVVRPWTVHGLAALAAWLPFSAVGFVWLAADRFGRSRTATWPALPAMGFLAWMFSGVFVAALAHL